MRCRLLEMFVGPPYDPCIVVVGLHAAMAPCWSRGTSLSLSIYIYIYTNMSLSLSLCIHMYKYIYIYIYIYAVAAPQNIAIYCVRSMISCTVPGKPFATGATTYGRSVAFVHAVAHIYIYIYIYICIHTDDIDTYLYTRLANQAEMGFRRSTPRRRIRAPSSAHPPAVGPCSGTPGIHQRRNRCFYESVSFHEGIYP